MPETRVSPQVTWRCACPGWSSPQECIRIRYGRNPTAGDPTDEPEECECPCHDEEEENEDA